MPKKILKFFTDIFFPEFCLSCNELNTLLCKDCFKKIKFITNQVCPICKSSSFYGRTCIICRNKTPLEGLIVGTSYQNLTQTLIKTFKYRNIPQLANPLSQIILQVLPPSLLINSIFCSVPLSKWRQLNRGYNQSELLALALSKTTGTPYLPLLIRQKATRFQYKFGRLSRINNVLNSFKINYISFKASRIIIIDDIATSLSTLNECAKIIKQYYNLEVWGVVLARKQE